ncbi:MAG: hypothetical protein HYW05_05620 [Candidatus Diapherotrites archaeon]|nr:hypothetical protein [Candidatus Diapherotrites archaeon]
MATELITMASFAFIFQFFFGQGPSKVRTLESVAAFLGFSIVVGLLAVALNNFLLLVYFLFFSALKMHAYISAAAKGATELFSTSTKFVVGPLIQFISFVFALVIAAFFQILYMFLYLLLTTIGFLQQASSLEGIANFFGSISWGDLAVAAGGQIHETQALLIIYSNIPYAPRIVAAVLAVYFFIAALTWAWPYIRKTGEKDFRANVSKLEAERPEELKIIREKFKAKAQRYENQQYMLFESAAPEEFGRFLRCKNQGEKVRLLGSLMNQIKAKNPKGYEASLQMLKDLGNEFERELNTLAKNTKQKHSNT